MKKFEYLQVKYSEYPSTEQLNVVGVNGWELIQYQKVFMKKRYTKLHLKKK